MTKYSFFSFKFEVDAVHLFVFVRDEILSFDLSEDEVRFWFFNFEVDEVLFFSFKLEVDDVHLFVFVGDEILSFDFAGDEVLFWSFKFKVVSGDDEVLSFDFAGDEVLFVLFKFEVDAVHLFVSEDDDDSFSHINDNKQS